MDTTTSSPPPKLRPAAEMLAIAQQAQQPEEPLEEPPEFAKVYDLIILPAVLHASDNGKAVLFFPKSLLDAVLPSEEGTLEKFAEYLRQKKYEAEVQLEPNFVHNVIKVGDSLKLSWKNAALRISPPPFEPPAACEPPAVCEASPAFQKSKYPPDSYFCLRSLRLCRSSNCSSSSGTHALSNKASGNAPSVRIEYAAISRPEKPLYSILFTGTEAQKKQRLRSALLLLAFLLHLSSIVKLAPQHYQRKHAERAHGEQGNLFT